MCVSSRWLVTVVARSEKRPIGIMFWSVCTVAVQKGLVFHEIILFVILVGNFVVVPHNLNGICFLQFMKLQLNPASSNILPPDGSSPVTQMISVNNSLYGQVSIYHSKFHWFLAPRVGELPVSKFAIVAGLCGFTQTQKIDYLHLLLWLQKPLIMRLRITYKAAGRNVLEQVQVNDFPAGL
jgi:hypothetical protein